MVKMITSRKFLNELEQSITESFVFSVEQTVSELLPDVVKRTGRLRFEIENTFMEQAYALLLSDGSGMSWNLDAIEALVVDEDGKSYGLKYIWETEEQTYFPHATTPNTGAAPAYKWIRYIHNFIMQKLPEILRNKGYEVIVS